MNASQKLALYNLAVVIATLAVVAALVPAFGSRAQGGFALLSLTAIGPFLFRKRSGGVVEDERDGQIRLRAMLISYSFFWVAFVLSCVSAGLIYGWDGSVPVALVVGSVWCGWILVQGVASVAMLLQYRSGVSDAS